MPLLKELVDLQEVFGDKPEEKLEVLKTRLQRAGTGKKARRILFNWIKKGQIDFDIFDKIITDKNERILSK